MGSSSSVNMKDTYAAEEAERSFQNKMTQKAVDYCREHLFTESPMSITEVSDDLMLFKVDEARLNEMLDPVIGRIGAPFLVKFNSKTGNLFVQLFPDRKPQHQCNSPIIDTITLQNSTGDQSLLSPSSRPTSPSSPLLSSSSIHQQRRNSGFRRSSSRPLTSPSTPNRSNSSNLLLVTSLDKIRVIFGFAYMSKLDVPDVPTKPVMVEQSPHHITIEWEPPWNDGGLIEKYEVEFKRAQKGLWNTDSADQHPGHAAYLARNPNKYGWRKLRTLLWYDWSYFPYEEDTIEEQEQILKQLLLQHEETKTSQDMKEECPLPSSSFSSRSSTSSPPVPPDIDHSNQQTFLDPRGKQGRAYSLRADLRELRPASCFQFRVRAANHFGFSEFSEVSDPLQSSPTPPSQPNPPFAVYTSGDAMWLSWSHPELNGLPLQVFELSWKIPGQYEPNSNEDISSSSGGNGGGGCVILEAVASSGGGSSFFLRRLRPRTTYSVSLRARNAVGWSPASSPASITTNRFAADISVLDRSFAALRHRDWWVERYDARARCPFLFNVLTGERQGHAPAVVDTMSTREEEGNRQEGENSGLDVSGGRLVDEDEDEDFQQPGTALVFMRKRRSLQRALLVHMRSSSSSSPSLSSSPPTSPSLSSTSSSSNNESKYLWMNTARCDVLSSMLTRFTSWDTKFLRMKRIKVIYEGEDGIDSGGLGKDFFASVAAALVTTKTKDEEEDDLSNDSVSGQPIRNQNYDRSSTAIRYFTPTPTGDRVEICPSGNGSPSAWRAIGRFIAKAVIDRQLIPKLQLSIPLLKQILGRELTLEDLKGVDEALYNSLQWALSNSIQGVLDDETFTVTNDSGIEEVELCEGGKDLKVTNENKQKYVSLRVSWYFKYRYLDELDSLLAGFTDLIPTKLLESFDVSELERLLVGCSEIQVDEIRAFAVFGGEYTSSSAVVLWFWEYWRAQSAERRGVLLNFVTASSRLPLDGFDPPFCVVNGGSGEELPRSHTCFNQLVLPKYTSYDAMTIKLDIALDHASEGFFAT